MKNVNLFLFILCFTSTLFSQSDFGCKHTFAKEKSYDLQKRGANPKMANYDVTYYNIDLNSSNLSTFIRGFVQIDVKSTVDNLDSVLFNLANNFMIDSVMINDVKTTYSFKKDELSIYLLSLKNKNDAFSVKIYYNGNGTTSKLFGAGLLSYNKYIFTLSAPYYAYLWFPCKQDLNDKADSVAVNITTQKTNEVASNGVLVGTKLINDSLKRFSWKSNYPIDYYLISYAIGPFTTYTTYAKPKGYNDSILIYDFYPDQNFINSNQAVIQSTKSLIELFSDKFSLYPFHQEKYGQYVINNKNSSMEHQTMSLLSWFNFKVVAHELAHQWFGNHVTCETLNDVWINEGFATYSEYIAYEHLQTPTLTKNLLLAMQNYAFVTEGRVYVSDSLLVSPNAIYNPATTYCKGGTILHMLRFELGDDSLFFQVLRNYQTKFAHKNASTADFKNIVNEVSKKDFTYFFDQWIYGYGYPKFTFQYNQLGDTLYISSKQTGSSKKTPFFKMKLDFRATSSQGAEIFTAVQTKNEECFKFYYPAKTITRLTSNPAKWNLMKNVVNDSLIAKNSALALNNIESNAIAVYPIPTTGKLYITPDPAIISVRIYDLSGREVYASGENLVYEIDLSFLKSDMYLLKIDTVNGTHVYKIEKE